MAQARREEIENLDVREDLIHHIADLRELQDESLLHEPQINNWRLPFDT